MVSLVEDDENVAGNFSEESGEFVVAESRAGGIIGIGDIDDAGFGRNGGGNRVEIEGVIAHAGLRKAGAAGTHGDSEEGEAAFTGDAVQAGAEEHARGEIDDFAGAETDEDFFEADIIAGGEDFAETLAAAVGIPVGFTERAAGGFHSFGRGAERIFVGGEFHGVNLEVLLDFFNGLAGNVGGEALDVVGDEFFESVSHEFIL